MHGAQPAFNQAPLLAAPLPLLSGSFNETFRFLFWTMFGMEEHQAVDMPRYLVAESVGRALYGIFTIVMVIVLLNMLIAMITNSFQKIEVRLSCPGAERPPQRRAASDAASLLPVPSR